MSDEANKQADDIVLGETGYRRDLREAENAMSAAGDPALADAMRRHAEAVRNMMIAELMPPFENALGRMFDQKLAPLGEGIGGLQLGLNQLNERFQSISETVDQLVSDNEAGKADRAAIHSEVSAVKNDISVLQVAITSISNEFANYRAGSRRHEIDVIKEQIAELRGPFDSLERERLIAILMDIIADWEDKHHDQQS